MIISKKKKTKKIVKNKLVKHPNQLSVKDLKRKTSKFDNNLYRAIEHILDRDGISKGQAPFISYVLNVIFKYDCLFDDTTSPFYMKLVQETECKDDDDPEVYSDVLKNNINRQYLLSAIRDYVTDTAGGKLKASLNKIDTSWR